MVPLGSTFPCFGEEFLEQTRWSDICGASGRIVGPSSEPTVPGIQWVSLGGSACGLADI